MWQALSWLGFLLVGAAFISGSPVAGMRVMGLLTLGHAIGCVVVGKVPYGWEGREPSGYITGFPLILFSVFMGAVALAMLVRPHLMLALFGWA